MYIIIVSNPPTRLSKKLNLPSLTEVRQMEVEMKCLALVAQRFPLHLRNLQLKVKISDWELARIEIPICLPVQGYIQSERQLRAACYGR
jgi:hypothetical protein